MTNLWAVFCDSCDVFYEIQSLEWHPNCITGSKVMVILLNGWILPRVASGRVCDCSLCSRLVNKICLGIGNKNLAPRHIHNRNGSKRKGGINDIRKNCQKQAVTACFTVKD